MRQEAAAREAPGPGAPLYLPITAAPCHLPASSLPCRVQGVGLKHPSHASPSSHESMDMEDTASMSGTLAL